MKKILLFAALFAASVANAQEVFQMNGEDFGLSSDAVEVAAGAAWGSTSYGDIYNPFVTGHKLVDCKNNDFNQVTIGGQVILTKGGVQGQDNPKDIDGQNPGVSLVAPSQGAVVGFTAAKDGYAYIVAKLSSNKNYYVFEEGTPVPFTLAMDAANDAFPGGKIVYTTKGEMQDGIEVITDNTWTGWPEKVVLGADAEDVKVNGLGVIGFQIYEGCKYLVGAGGSKISWCGMWFGDAPADVVLDINDGEVEAHKHLIGAGDGISNVAVQSAQSVMFNLAGQRVNDAKGIVVLNGKKVIR